MNSAAISVRDLSVSYGKNRVISNLALDVEEGTWLGLIGPNGAGKSTLLKAMLGLAEHSGTVTFAGETLAGRDRARRVAYLPQYLTMPDGMTVAEYVLLGRTAHLSWLASEGDADRRAAADAMERLDVTKFATRNVGDMSGGESQRVALARALAQEASILLLDEPTSALDLGHQMSVLGLISELQAERNLTIVAAMHDLTATGRFADSLVLLDGGTIVTTGSAEAVLRPEVLEAVYGGPVDILRADDGSLVVVPLRSETPLRTDNPARTEPSNHV